MYGSHSISRPPGRHTSNPNPSSNPAQPEWRLPATKQQSSWQAEATTSSPSPPPPPQPPRPVSAAAYHSYAPISSTLPAVSTGVSTSPVPSTADSWGVGYGQQHRLQSPPPLPPRPSSVGEQHHFQTLSPVGSSSDFNQPAPAVEHPPQWASTPFSYTTQQAVKPLPPPPPPISVDYQNQAWQQQVHPHVYPELPMQHYTLSVSPLQAHLPTLPMRTSSLSPPPVINTVAPVTYDSVPITAPPIPPKVSASALGFSGPSDWEHLAPTPGHIEDAENFAPKQTSAASAVAVVDPLPSDTTAGPSVLSPHSGISTSPLRISPTVQSAHAQDSTEVQKQFNGSPVSPDTIQGIHNPPRPVTVDSDSNFSTFSVSETSERIDGVIEAWTKPVFLEATAPDEQDQDRQSSPPSNEAWYPLQKLSPLEIPKPEQESIVPPKEVPPIADIANSEPSTKTEALTVKPKPHDPFEDLDPWSKSSVARYVAMLRKEEVADSDEERFRIFTAFMAKETKLREILYSIEHEPKITDDVSQQSVSVPQNPTENSAGSSSPVQPGLIPVESEEDYLVSSDATENTGSGRYSPGGRPILPRLHTPKPAGLQRSASQPIFKGKHPVHGMHDPFFRATSVPPSMNDRGYSPLTTNPPQPIYTPFRYTEGPQRGSDNLTFDRPAYQAYSALRQASAESGRVMSNAPTSAPSKGSSSTLSAPVQDDHDETFIGLIREKSVTYQDKTSRRTSSPPRLPIPLRQGKVVSPIDELRSMVSSPLTKQSESSWHVTMRKDLEIFSDDFSYIREARNAWETEAKARREKLDQERMQRQEESEKHIDALFNEKEIGYADINVLEEEFRQTEAREQLDEERRELDDFIKNVFDSLDGRLEEEISALQGYYESALSQLNDQNGKSKDSVTDKDNMSHTMNLVNDIFKKLEVRYQKRLGIALDRERRRKKTERRPLVFMGDSAALKRLDKDFDQMEKRNLLEAAKAHDDRTNRLMDSFDDAIMRGLGENLSLLDEFSATVARIDSSIIHSSGLADSEIEQFLKSVFTIVESLRQESESILRNFGVADSALNNADYTVSVAEARCSNSDADIFRRLDDEKKKEDAKIQSDLNSKLESVRAGPAKITAKINEILESLGKAPVVVEQSVSSETIPAIQPVDMLLPGPRPAAASIDTKKPDEDAERQERLRKALEDAKKRNAAKNNS